VVRDVLIREIPTVLRTDIYALAALIGATAIIGGHALHLPSYLPASLGAVLCFVIRLGAMHYGWRLPAAKVPGNQTSRR